MTPVKIKVSCGKHDAEITIVTLNSDIGIEVNIDNVVENDESYAVWNIVTLCLVGLGIPRDEVEQRLAGLQ